MYRKNINKILNIAKNKQFRKETFSIIEILIVSTLVNFCLSNVSIKYFNIFITDTIVTSINSFVIQNKFTILEQHRYNIFERYFIYTIVSLLHFLFDFLTNNFVDISIVIQFISSPFFFSRIHLFSDTVNNLNKVTNFILSNLIANIASYICTMYLGTYTEIYWQEISVFMVNIKSVLIDLIKTLLIMKVTDYVGINKVFNIAEKLNILSDNVATRKEISQIVTNRKWDELFSQRVIKKLIMDETVFKEAFYRDKKEIQIILVKFSFLYGLSYIFNNNIIFLISTILSIIEFYKNYPFYENKKLILAIVSKLCAFIILFFQLPIVIGIILLDFYSIFYLSPKPMENAFNFTCKLITKIRINYTLLYSNAILVYLSYVLNYYNFFMIAELTNNPKAYLTIFISYTNNKSLWRMIIYFILLCVYDTQYDLSTVNNIVNHIEYIPKIIMESKNLNIMEDHFKNNF